MDAITPKEMVPEEEEKRFLPALAEAIVEWFPELQGRALAVSEVSVTKENVPTLPLVMVAFLRSAGEAPTRNSRDSFDVADEFIVEFWLEPSRYKRANGSETPFWSYYDYEAIRDTLLQNLTRWEAPGCERISYRTLTIGADPFAVTLSFAFTASFRWKAKTTEFGDAFKIGLRLLTPTECCFPEEPDPCA